MDITIRGDSRGVRFVSSSCHFIFILFVEGNRVSEVE